jgi:hypothetical protein
MKTTKSYFYVHGILFLLLCTLILPSVGALQASVAASDGDIPTYYQGDQWTYTIDPLSFTSTNVSFTGAVHNLQQTVVGITGDAYEISITGDITGDITVSGLQGTLSGGITGMSYQRVSDLAQETTSLHSTGNIYYIIPFPYQMDVVVDSTPALEAFDFPVNVGEQWEISGLSTTTGVFSIAGVFEQSLNGSQWVDETVQCDAQEQISVPAGTFPCYTITRPSASMWYSSEVGNIVQSTVDLSSQSGTIHATMTLQSFLRSAQPITISENLEPWVTIPGVVVEVSGQAYTTATGDPIQNTTVSIDIPSAGQTWAGMTDAAGYYRILFSAPTMVDDTPSGRETGSGGVIVQCTDGGLNGYHVQTLVTVNDVAPTTPTLNGPSKGKPGIAYTYTILSTDVENDMVFYFIDWGDNTSTGWQGAYYPGMTLAFNHTFAAKGIYTIKAMARDVYGAESDWGTLQVNMPLSSVYDHHPILSSLERFLHKHPSAFPILRLILGFLEI